MLPASSPFDVRVGNGTSMCNYCARLPLNQQFVQKVILKEKDSIKTPHKFTPNCHLSSNQKDNKLRSLVHTIRIYQHKGRRNQARGVRVTKESFARKDVGKFVMELNYISLKGTLDNRKVMWSYLQDVVRAEFLKARRGGNAYSRAMKWSQDTKDLFVVQKTMYGKGICHSQRNNVGGPSLSTVW